MRTRRISALVAVIVVSSLAAASADARKPIVSYLDGGVLKLHDLELGVDVPAPAITVPGMVPRYALSLDGRYVLWLDDAVPSACTSTTARAAPRWRCRASTST